MGRPPVAAQFLSMLPAAHSLGSYRLSASWQVIGGKPLAAWPLFQGPWRHGRHFKAPGGMAAISRAGMAAISRPGMAAISIARRPEGSGARIALPRRSSPRSGRCAGAIGSADPNKRLRPAATTARPANSKAVRPARHVPAAHA